MDTSKKVSIIVPVYNMEALLPRCIDSLINQTYPNIEILLIDDGSPDASGRICDEYAKRDLRVKVFHKKNGGVADASNVGLDNMTGDFLIFVDSDDYIGERMIEVMLSRLYEYDADAVQCGAVRVTEKGEESEFAVSRELRVLTGGEVMDVFFLERRVIPFNMAFKLYKKELYDGIRFEVGSMLIDAPVTPVVLSRCRKYVMIPECFYYVYWVMASVSRGQVSDRYFEDELKIIGDWEKFLEEKYPENRDYFSWLAYMKAFRAVMLYSAVLKSERVTNPDEKLSRLKKMFDDNYADYKKMRARVHASRGERVRIRLFAISPKLMLKFFDK